MTGASGAAYGLRALQRLLGAGHQVHFVVSQAGRRVAAEETDQLLDGDSLHRWTGASEDQLVVHDVNHIGAAIASGSFRTLGMLLLPCSMGTVGRIAQGLSGNLIERAADVHLKERRPLVVAPRETPWSVIHLENLTRLARAGAIVLPASPGFYRRPRRVEDLVDFVVERALQCLGLDLPRSFEWTGGQAPAPEGGPPTHE